MEAAAFERDLRPLLHRSGAYAVSLLGSRKDAEDAVQQAALQGWQRRAQYDSERPFKAWWFAILRNYCLDELRRRKRAPLPITVEDANLSSPADESVLNRVAVERAMEKLPEMQREVLRLRYYGDLTYQEMGHVLGIPTGTVMSRLHLARKALAVLITAEEP
ncbi:MAG TPA: RNA polymerase sigma factor [Allosphingosinicella sp.]|nr:RNA polymerase sigma factor [Allosphingosinicella sp.]